MGNNNSATEPNSASTSSGMQEEEDAVVESLFQGLDVSTLLNSEVLNSLISDLPDYNLTRELDDVNQPKQKLESVQDTTGANASKFKHKGQADNALNLKKIMAIFSQSKKVSYSAEDFEVLSSTESRSASLYETTSTIRGCALRKLHQVLSRKLNQRKNNTSSQNNVTTGRNQFLDFAETSVEEHEFPEVEIAVEMALGIAESLAHSNDTTMLLKIADVLFKALAVKNDAYLHERSKPQLVRIVQSVVDFALKLLGRDNQEIQRVGFKILLNVALQTGSISILLFLASKLEWTSQSDDMLTMLMALLCRNNSDYDLKFPTSTTKQTCPEVKTLLTEPVRPELGCYSIAAAAGCTFVWDNTRNALSKLGADGKVVARNEQLLHEYFQHAYDPAVYAALLPTFDPTNKYGAIQLDQKSLTATLQRNADKTIKAVIYLDKTLTFTDIGLKTTCDEAHFNYFEIEVVDAGSCTAVAIGFATPALFPATETANMPGWHAGSYGLHSDDGVLYGENKKKECLEKWTTGDIIGCGIDVATRTIFYTKNGKFSDEAFKFTDSTLTPVVAIFTGSTVPARTTTIRLNAGQAPFKYSAPGNMVMYALPAFGRVNANIAVVKERLYLHIADQSNTLLCQRNDQVGVVSTKSLKLVETMNLTDLVKKGLHSTAAVDGATSSASAGSAVVLEDQNETCFTFACAGSNGIRICSSNDQPFAVTRCLVNKGVGNGPAVELDVTTLPLNFNATRSRLYISNVLELESVQAIVAADSSIDTVNTEKWTISLECAFEVAENVSVDEVVDGIASGLSVPITAYDNSLLCIYARKKPTRCLYSMLDIEVDMDDTVVVVDGTQVSALWLDYCNCVEIFTTSTVNSAKYILSEETTLTATVACTARLRSSAVPQFVVITVKTTDLLLFFTQLIEAAKDLLLVHTKQLYFARIAFDRTGEATTTVKKIAYHVNQLSCGETLAASALETLAEANVMFNGSVAALKTKQASYQIKVDSGAVLVTESAKISARIDFVTTRYALDASTNSVVAFNCKNSVLQRYENPYPLPSFESPFIAGLPMDRIRHLLKLKINVTDINDDGCSTQQVSYRRALLYTLVESKCHDYTPPNAKDCISMVSTRYLPEHKLLDVQSTLPYSLKSREISLLTRSNKSNAPVCTVIVDGSEVSLPANKHKSMFIITLDDTYRFHRLKQFDNSTQNVQGKMISEFIDYLPDGTVVLAITCTSLMIRGIKAFEKLGCDVSSLPTNATTFAMIGRKGLSVGQAVCTSSSKQQALLTLTRFIPIHNIPFAFEFKSYLQQFDIFEQLIDIVQSQVAATSSLFTLTNCDGLAATEYADLSMLHSALSILTCQMTQLLRGRTEAECAAVLSDGVKHKLTVIINDLMKTADAQTPGGKCFGALATTLLAVSMHVLYPTIALKKQLLDSLFEKYRHSGANFIEERMLAVVMHEVGESEEIIQLLIDMDGEVTSEGEGASKNQTAFFASLGNVVAAEMKKLFVSNVDLDELDFSGKFTFFNHQSSGLPSLGYSASVAIQNFNSILLVKSSQQLPTDTSTVEDETTDATPRADKDAIRIIASLSKMCSSIFDSAMECLSTTSDGPAKTVLFNRIQKLVQHSLVGTLLPISLTAATSLIQSLGYNLLKQGLDVIGDFVSSLENCNQQLSKLLQLMPAESQIYDDLNVDDQQVPDTQVFESLHNYKRNTESYTTIKFSNAKCVKIVFDPQSRTETGNDYVEFVDFSKKSLHPHIPNFSGTAGSENFPGFGGRPPLIIQSNNFQLHFHSNNSVEDWGYKLTATAIYPTKITSTHNPNWLLSLEFDLCSCLGTLASSLMTGQPWHEELEGTYAQWIEDNIVRPDIFDGVEGATEEDRFLLDLIKRPEDSAASKFAKIMRGLVRDDQGSIAPINEAVYGTCAVIIKYNNLVAEALAIAENADQKPSGALVKAWTSGQNMRRYFDYNDSKQSIQQKGQDSDRTAEDGVTQKKLPSLYAGADEEVFVQHSATITEKVRLLLRTSAPSVFDTPSNDLNDLNISGTFSPVRMNSYPSRENTQSKLKLAGRAVMMKRQISEDSQNVLSMWHSLVDEASVMEKLKNIFVIQRKFVEKQRSKGLTVTEKILNFLQSEQTVVSKLGQLNRLRNKRAVLRSKGLDIFANLLNSKLSMFAIQLVAQKFSTCLRMLKRDEEVGPSTSNTLHYLNGILGCSPTQNLLVCQKFAAFCNSCVLCIRSCYESRVSIMDSQVRMWEKALISCIRLCVLDFEHVDHAILHECGILDLLSLLSTNPYSERVASAANALLEVLTIRCLGIDNDRMDVVAEPSEFSLKLIGQLTGKVSAQVDRLNEGYFSSSFQRESSEIDATVKVTAMVSGTRLFQRHAPGYSFPHLDVYNNNQSFSAWIRRPKSDILDNHDYKNMTVADLKQLMEESISPIHFIKGPASTENDKGYSSIATLKAVSAEYVSLEWTPGTVARYNFSRDKQKISLADPNVCGHLFSKGAPYLSMMDALNANTFLPAWSLYGARILADGHLNVFIASNEKVIYNIRSETVIPCNQWSNIGIAVTESQLKLFLNGKLDSTMSLPSALQQHEVTLNNNNLAPYYLGQIPYYICNKSIPLNGGVNCMLSALTHYSRALQDEEVLSIHSGLNTAQLDADAHTFDDNAILGIFAALRLGLLRSDNLHHMAIRRVLSSEQLLTALVSLMKNGNNVLKCASFRVCASILPLLDMAQVNGCFKRCRLFDGKYETLPEFLLCTIGSSMNVWHRYCDLNQSDGEASKVLRESAEAEFGVAVAEMVLLKALIKSEDSDWSYSVTNLLIDFIDSVPVVIDVLQKLSDAEVTTEPSSEEFFRTDRSAAADYRKQVDTLYGLLFLLDEEDYPVVHVGAMARYTDPSSGLTEDCMILGSGEIPIYDRKTDKQLAEEWDFANDYVDSINVMLLSEPGHYTTVPRKRLQHSTPSNVASKEEVHEFMRDYIGVDRMMTLFSCIVNVNARDSRKKLLPKMRKYINVNETEPFNDETLVAAEMSPTVVTGEEQSADSPAAVNSAGSSAGDVNGVTAIPKLADASIDESESSQSENFGLNMLFSGSSSKVTASTMEPVRACEVSPPNLPVLPNTALLVHLKMVGMKTYLFNLKNCSWLIAPSLEILQHVVNAALMPTKDSIIRNPVVTLPKSYMYESTHPYTQHSKDVLLDMTIPITVPGAKKIMISFDPKSELVPDIDHLTIFTDQDCKERVLNADMLSGPCNTAGKEWPGVGNSKCVTVNQGYFYVKFHRGSLFSKDNVVHNAWGWRFFVTIAGDSINDNDTSKVVRGAGLSADNALHYCFYLQQFLLDGPKRENVISKEDYESFHSIAAIAESSPLKLTGFDSSKWTHEDEKTEDEARLEEKSSFERISPVRPAMPDFKHNAVKAWPKTFKVLQSTVRIYPYPNDTVKPVGSLAVGVCVTGTEEKADWLHVLIEPKLLDTAAADDPDDNDDDFCTSKSRESVTKKAMNSNAYNLPVEGWIRTRVAELENVELVPDLESTTKLVPVPKDISHCAELLNNNVDDLSYDATRDFDSPHLLQHIAEDLIKKPVFIDTAAKPKMHPMYTVSDKTLEKTTSGASSSKTSSNQPLSVRSLLKLEINRIEEAFVEYSELAASKLAAECVNTVIKNWPLDTAFRLEYFQDMPTLLKFLVKSTTTPELATTEKVEENEEDATGPIIQPCPLLNIIIKSDELNLISNAVSESVLSMRLVEFAKAQLKSAWMAELSADMNRTGEKKSTFGLMHTVESPHPYKESESWILSFPGAERIEVIFAAESDMSPDLDFITVTSTDGTVEFTPIRIQSAASSVSNYLPGVNAPKLVVDSSSCKVIFTVQSKNNTSWGFKAFAFGVYNDDYLTSNQTVSDEQTAISSPNHTNMSYQILQSYLYTKSPSIQIVLFDFELLKLLIIHLLSKIPVLEVEERSGKSNTFLCLFSAYVVELSKTKAPTIGMIKALSTLKNVLCERTNRMYSSESKSGTTLQNLSPLLQFYVELLLIIDNCVENMQLQLELNMLSSKGTRQTRWTACANCQAVKLSADGITATKITADPAYSIVSGAKSRQTRRLWDIRLIQFADKSPMVGLLYENTLESYATDALSSDIVALCSLAWDGRNLHFGGMVVPFGNGFYRGDVVSIEVDLRLKSVALYRNFAKVGDVLGPRGSGALIEVYANLKLSSLVPAACLYSLNDSVELGDSVLDEDVSDPVDASEVAKSLAIQDPAWLIPVKEAMSLLNGITQHQVPRSILDSEFVPSCVTRVVDESKFELTDYDFNAAQTKEYNKEITVQGASSIKIQFDESNLVKGDIIEILDADNNVLTKLDGLVCRTELDEAAADIDSNLFEPPPNQNRAGIPILLGSGTGVDNYYCGRDLGVSSIPGSDGRCGSNNGPQCADCKGFIRGAPRNRAGYLVALDNLPTGEQGYCCGRKIDSTEARCGVNAPQCKDCSGFIFTSFRNKADYLLTPSNALDSNAYYCGRKLGRFAFEGGATVDGRCGPNFGPQCLDCKGASFHRNTALVPMCLSHKGVEYYCGQIVAGKKCAPGSGLGQCMNCKDKLETADKYSVSCHSHSLVRNLSDNGWVCDGSKLAGGCKQGCTAYRQTTGWHRYRCGTCDYDLCIQCLCAQLVEITTIPVVTVQKPVSSSARGNLSAVSASYFTSNASAVEAVSTQFGSFSSMSQEQNATEPTGAGGSESSLPESSGVEQSSVANVELAALSRAPEVMTQNRDRLYSSEQSEVVTAVTYFRRLLSIEVNPPIQEVIDLGMLPRFIELLSATDAVLQFEAAWALTNVASGTSFQTRAVLQAGALPLFVQLLSSPYPDVKEQATWAIGNIAGDSVENRDLVLSHGAMPTLLQGITNALNAGEFNNYLRNAAWTLSNLVRQKPSPPFAQIEPCLPVLVRILGPLGSSNPDMELLKDSCWAVSYVSDGSNDRIQAIIDSGMLPRIVEFLTLYENNTGVLSPSLRIVGNVATGDEVHTQAVIDLNGVVVLKRLLGHHKKTIRKEACWTLSNITAGTIPQIQAVIDCDVLPIITNLLAVGEIDIKREAAWVVCNATNGTREQVEYLISPANVIQPLVNQLEIGDSKLRHVVVEGLTNILTYGASSSQLRTILVEINCRAIITEIVDEMQESGTPGVQPLERLLEMINEIIGDMISSNTPVMTAAATNIATGITSSFPEPPAAAPSDNTLGTTASTAVPHSTSPTHFPVVASEPTAFTFGMSTGTNSAAQTNLQSTSGPSFAFGLSNATTQGFSFGTTESTTSTTSADPAAAATAVESVPTANGTALSVPPVTTTAATTSTAASTSSFPVDETTVSAMEEMGFFRGGILAAIHNLRTNDMQLLVPYVLENPFAVFNVDHAPGSDNDSIVEPHPAVVDDAAFQFGLSVDQVASTADIAAVPPETVPESGLPTVSEMAPTTTIMIGDTVVRGPGWKWGDQDGGAGGVGQVVGVSAWNGLLGCGVTVRWREGMGHEGLYRFFKNPADCDLTVVTRHFIKKNGRVTQATLNTTDNSLIVPGGSVALRVVSAGMIGGSTTKGATDQAPAEHKRILKVRFIPTLSLGACLTNPDFHLQFKELESQYCSPSLAGDLALVQHINKVCRAKTTSKDAIFRKKWSEFIPTDTDLTSSAALKELFLRKSWGADDSDETDIHSLMPVHEEAHPVDVESDTVSTASAELIAPVRTSLRHRLTCRKEASHPVFSPLNVEVKPIKEGLKSRVKIEGSSLLRPSMCGTCNQPCNVPFAVSSWGEGTCWICDSIDHVGPKHFTGEDIVYGCSTSKKCNWGLCEACYQREKIAAEATAASVKPYKPVAKTIKPIASHFALLQLLNMSLAKALPFVDLSKKNHIPGSFPALVLAYRGLIYEVIKNEPFKAALSRTAGSGSRFDLNLSRSKARKYASQGQADDDAKWSVFAQAFRVIHKLKPTSLRRSDRLFYCNFMGEFAVDQGGPYREAFAIFAQELQSKSLSLLLPTPNGIGIIGQNREKWILNPGASSSTLTEMYAFLGKLMGIAVRSKEYLALNLPSFVWKSLVNDTPTSEDLEGVDLNLVKSLNRLRNIDKEGVTAELFDDLIFETFTTNSSDNRTIELVADGANIPVTFETRHRYCDLVIQYRLHEFDAQASAIRSGLGTIIPLSLLNLFTWEQLEIMVCGYAEVNIDLLESIAEYSGCKATDEHVKSFWQALREFDNEERSALIKFTWGRSRLPLKAADFPQRFKLQSFHKSPPDSYYPVSHTCYFSLELPRYSTLAIMKEKLRYAIFNCEAIDGDDGSSGMAVAAMGWEG